MEGINPKAFGISQHDSTQWALWRYSYEMFYAREDARRRAGLPTPLFPEEMMYMALSANYAREALRRSAHVILRRSTHLMFQSGMGHIEF